MPRIDAYRQGVPAWVDVSSPDVEASAAFYCSLFGWEVGPDLGADAGGYRLFTKDGAVVAGIGPLMEGFPSWTTYLKVDDVVAAAERVEPAGGNLVVPPMDLPDDSGRMAVAIDATGAFVALFEPGPNHSGAQLVNEVGTVVWNELNTRDPDGAEAFYGAVVGLTATRMPEMDYRTLEVSGRAVAGMMPMQGVMPDEVPPHWLTYFAVDDVAASLARVVELGGSVVAGPMDTPVGPLAVVADPTGATFAIGAFTQIDDPNDWG